jgi:PHP family Zn ribbon phosphoesterase
MSCLVNKYSLKIVGTMKLIVDLQLHSKYSRAVSKHMTTTGILTWAKTKGIDLIATGDWTHPLWMKEIQENLEEIGNGFLKLKSCSTINVSNYADPMYVLATEVSCIYTQGGRGRRIHTLIWVPTINSAVAINKEMTRRGCNLLSDGRPIIGLTVQEICELVFTIEPKALIIPAHAWTPWFSLFGSMSGFDSLQEAFGPFSDSIYAIETGLSSNPAMNWQIKELDTRSILSFSDAHSGIKLGREATVFEFKGNTLTEFTYDHLYAAISKPFFEYSAGKTNEIVKSIHEKTKQSQPTIAFTIEFYPEEGKYHYSGHRLCSIRWTPEETRTKGTTCPVCGKPFIQGVMQRVEELSGRSEKDLQLTIFPFQLHSTSAKLQMTKSLTFPYRPPFTMLVPLHEIIAECIGSPPTSKKVLILYEKITNYFKGEFTALLSADKADLVTIAGERIAQAIEKVRKGDIYIDPGFDGVFGRVKLWKDTEQKPSLDSSKEQLTLPL